MFSFGFIYDNRKYERNLKGTVTRLMQATHRTGHGRIVDSIPRAVTSVPNSPIWVGEESDRKKEFRAISVVLDGVLT